MQIKHSKLGKRKMAALVSEWIYRTPATAAARKLGLNPRTCKLRYQEIREGIWAMRESPFFEGPVEVDETYLVPVDPKAKRRATSGKIAVFGIFDRKTGKVRAEIVDAPRGENLLPIVLRHVALGATVYSDGFGGYYHLSKMGYAHRKVPHEYTFSTHPGVHTNHIESFWDRLQRDLAPKRGLSRRAFHLHVEEAVFLFNHRQDPNLRLILKRILDS